MEFSAIEILKVLRSLFPEEKSYKLPRLKLVTDLVPPTGRTTRYGRKKYSFRDLCIIMWLVDMRRQGFARTQYRAAVPFVCRAISKRITVHTTLLASKTQLAITDVKNGLPVHEVYNLPVIDPHGGRFTWSYDIGSLAAEIYKLVTKEKTDETSSDSRTARHVQRR